MKTPFPKYDAEVVAEIEAHLDMEYQTEIVQWSDYLDGLKLLWARGYTGPTHPRPMFELITEGAFSGMGQSVTPCTACYRFEYSWNCEEHHEVAWDDEERRQAGPSGAPRRPSDDFRIYQTLAEAYPWTRPENLEALFRLGQHSFRGSLTFYQSLEGSFLEDHHEAARSTYAVESEGAHDNTTP